MSAQPRLAQRLSDAISAGNFRPGEKLNQIELATEFGATRFEVRRALEELTLRKSVAHTPQKGYRVNVPDDEDINQFKVVRVILEREAAKMVVDNIDDAGISELRNLASDFRSAAENGTPAERNAANHRFHDVMYAFARNPMLGEVIKEMRDRVRGTPIYSWPSVQSMRQSAEDHDAIVDALEARDREGVAEAVHRHIMKGI